MSKKTFNIYTYMYIEGKTIPTYSKENASHEYAHKH